MEQSSQGDFKMVGIVDKLLGKRVIGDDDYKQNIQKYEEDEKKQHKIVEKNKYSYLLSQGWSLDEAKRYIGLQEEGRSPSEAYKLVKGETEPPKQEYHEETLEELQQESGKFGKKFSKEDIENLEEKVGEGIENVGKGIRGGVEKIKKSLQKTPEEIEEEKERKAEEIQEYKRLQKEEREYKHKLEIEKIRASRPIYGGFSAKKPKPQPKQRPVAERLARTGFGGTQFSFGGDIGDSGRAPDIRLPAIAGGFSLGRQPVKTQAKEITRKLNKKQVHK